MGGQLPDPDTRKRNRSSRTLPTTFLKASGFDGPIPDPPGQMSAEARRLYDQAWRSAPAAAWTESEAQAVAAWSKLAALVDAEVDTGVLPQAAILGALKAREDSLGLNPRARLSMRMTLVEDEDETEVELSRFEEFGEVAP